MNWWNRMRAFLKEVRAEMLKVSFPSRSEVISTSIVVCVTSAIFGAVLFASDRAILFVYRWLFEVLG